MRLLLAVLGGACVLALLIWIGVTGSASGTKHEKPQAAQPLALFTSLPIYWPEAPDPAALLEGSATKHWTRPALERQWALRPLDTLIGDGGLDSHRNLLMAQPRPLTPEENVALDNWLSAGGRLLLFADPALTAESAFALGDPRRPQDLPLADSSTLGAGADVRRGPAACRARAAAWGRRAASGSAARQLCACRRWARRVPAES